MLKVYNSLTNQKEIFTPIDPSNVRMYVCGMTVYDYCHIGHARVLVVFDIINRYLKKMYGEKNVCYVRNITDIDDKIINRANENHEPFGELTERFINAMHIDADILGVLRPDIEPRATTHIGDIIRMIEQLIIKGNAYHAENGDVYFDVSSFESYGQLSGKKLADLHAGERVAVEAAKQDPFDFVLWKAAKPGEPSWESPWGKGRPGWHIECSAMSTHFLGEHFDIHGGGLDLQFPHHENEIAQSEAACECTFVNYWLHNGFVKVDDEKMSKSLGNFFTIRDVLKNYDPEVIRFFILSSHYRSPLNYSDKHLDIAKNSLNTLYNALTGIEPALQVAEHETAIRFFAAMDDDFNTASAIAVLFELAREINRLKETDLNVAASHVALLKQLANVLGLLQRDPNEFRHAGTTSDSERTEPQIEALIQLRQYARSNKDWKEADRIRDELNELGVVLEDKPQGTIWRRC